MADLIAAMRAAVDAHSRRRVPFAYLAEAAYAADVSLLTAPDRRDRLAAAVRQLAEADDLRLPASRALWDSAALPSLPAWVERPTPSRRPQLPTRPRGWVDELAFAANAELSTSERRLLERVNDFLRDGGRAAEPVPLRERSYQLFGDEKRLDAVATIRLVTTGLLSIADHLRAYPTPPPLHTVRLGPAPWVLVVENAATFASLRTLVDELDPAERGCVGYGAGHLVTRAITSLAGHGFVRIGYFGDLDLTGLDIARAADREALTAGLPSVRPVLPFYRALLDRPTRAGSAADRQRAAEAATWLPAALRARTVQMLTAGTWLPQEALPLPLLRDNLRAARVWLRSGT